MDSKTRVAVGIFAGVLALSALVPCIALVALRTNEESPNETKPAEGPQPEWLDASIKIEVERIEGRTVHFKATTTLPERAALKATATRAYKHHDLGKGVKSPLLYGEVCSPEYKEVSGGFVRWSCTVDDFRWVGEPEPTEPKEEGHRADFSFVDDEIVVELRWTSEAVQHDDVLAVTGRKGQYLRGLCISGYGQGMTCSERIRVKMFYEPQPTK